MDFNADDLETYYNITTSSLYSYGDQDANTVPLPYHEAPDPGVRQEALTNQQVSVHPDVCTPHDPMIQELHTSREVSDLFRHSALKQMSWSTQPNEAGWERYKPRIEQLYKDNTLTEVMAIMKREHGLPIR